jgi:hypothetical protein
MVQLALVILVAIVACGCAALPLGALGAAAVSGGASSAMKAGTDMSFGGTVSRTFSAPLEEVHDAALATLQRLGIKTTEEERTEHGHAVVHGEAYGRTVSVAIEPITPVMTRVSLAVRSGLTRDRATAHEILVQTERALEHRAPLQTGAR